MGAFEESDGELLPRLGDNFESTRGGVYTLREGDEEGNVVRTGRSNDLARRRAEHGRDSILGQYFFNPEARTNDIFEQRGLEQELYDQNPSAQSGNDGYNKIRPISSQNPRYDDYMRAAARYRACAE
ncbi:MAG: hypothetical protein ACREMY_08790 [bacterium]